LYSSQIPNHLKEYISHVFDLLGNGNCGFQCLAKSLGYNADGWFQVREELVKEAKENIWLHSRAQGGEVEMRKIINNIEVASIESDITQTQWLSKLSHGQIIANQYKQPIVFLRILECLTFLPLRTYPCGGADPIYLLHVNNNH
jgi:histone-lysine N-methyltransferase SETD2